MEKLTQEVKGSPESGSVTGSPVLGSVTQFLSKEEQYTVVTATNGGHNCAKMTRMVIEVNWIANLVIVDVGKVPRGS